jgi:hypothetical protein
MNKKAPERKHKRAVIGVELMGQTPLLEHREFAPGNKLWVLWLAYNLQQDAGTFLVLHNNGEIMMETLSPTGAVSSVLIKPREK